MSMKTSRWCMAVFCLCAILVSASCKKKFKVPLYIPGPGTVTVPAPVNYECYLRHVTTPQPAGQRKIKVNLNIMATTITNIGLTTIFDQTIEVDPTVNPFPLTIPITIATNLSTQVETYIVGLECSECGNGWGGGGPYNCPPAVHFDTTGATYYDGARPRWHAVQTYTVIGSGSLTLMPAQRTLNEPNTCGCRVYY
jgi:hypothetical protein